MTATTLFHPSFVNYCARVHPHVEESVQVGYQDTPGEDIVWFEKAWFVDEAQSTQGSYLADMAEYFFDTM